VLSRVVTFDKENGKTVVKYVAGREEQKGKTGRGACEGGFVENVIVELR